MTLKHGRNGKRFFRAQQDPRGEWAAGTGGSAGFRPEQGVRFSAPGDKPAPAPPGYECFYRKSPSGHVSRICRPIGLAASPGIMPQADSGAPRAKANMKPNLKLPRHGAQPTRGANTAMRMTGETRRYSGTPSLLSVIQQNKKRR